MYSPFIHTLGTFHGIQSWNIRETHHLRSNTCLGCYLVARALTTCAADDPAAGMGNAEPPSSTPPARRRNGRLQACEPCRKRKVSCDHAFPACRRCRTQGNPDGCIYVASKQTGRRQTGRRVDDIAGATATAAGAAGKRLVEVISSITTDSDLPSNYLSKVSMQHN